MTRNDPCPCGSGLKYKRCCERAQRSRLSGPALILILIVVLGAAAGVTAYINAPADAVAPKRVWSAEHGHWHDVKPGGSEPMGVPGPQPPGPAPAGKIWSAEHGHWHDAGTGTAIPGSSVPPVPGPAIPLPALPDPSPAPPPGQ